jgi:hypothetical protein
MCKCIIMQMYCALDLTCGVKSSQVKMSNVHAATRGISVAHDVHALDLLTKGPQGSTHEDRTP